MTRLPRCASVWTMKDEASTPRKADAHQGFDAILEQLQLVVERLEHEELPLEDALRAFEEGMELSRRGQKILDEAERRVELLLRDGSTRPLAEE